jgi:VanZ family protein
LRSFARYWLPPLAWMALIWCVSSDIGSADHSAGPFAWIVQVLFPWATPAQIELAHLGVRKFGHMVEYGILAALWFRTFHAGRRLAFTTSALAALAISVLWAISDVVHQSFVPSRTPSAFDVLFDSVGATLCLLLLRLRVPREGGPRPPMPAPLAAPSRNPSRS